jgi:hypothetical protein
LLRGDGTGRFTLLTILQSGIFINGDGKTLAKLRGTHNEYLLVSTQNRGPVLVFKSKQQKKLIPVEPSGVYAIIDLGNGKKQKIEFNYGSSFRSQGGRFLTLPQHLKSCAIVNGQGVIRNISL